MTSNVVCYIKSCEDMSELSDGSVDLIVTNAPEWTIIRYSIKDKRMDPAYYIKIPREILYECYRVLREGGFLIWNVGFRSLMTIDYLDHKDTRAKLFSKHMYPYINAYTIVSWTPFILVGTVINTYRHRGRIEKQDADTDKPRQLYSAYEHWLMFSKGLDWEIKGKWSNVLETELSEFEMNEDIVKRFIDAFSPWGGLVLDPFCGSGTVGKVALENGRRAVMYEVEGKNVPRIREKVPGVEIVRVKGEKR